jgi:hypothetical protein
VRKREIEVWAVRNAGPEILGLLLHHKLDKLVICEGYVSEADL